MPKTAAFLLVICTLTLTRPLVQAQQVRGGAITLSAANDINITGDLYSYSSSFYGKVGQGGAITLTASNGSITTGNLHSYSGCYSCIGGQGGTISLTAASGSITTGDLYSSSVSISGKASQGGAITLTAGNGDITTGYLQSSSTSGLGNNSQGGAITLTAGNGNITTGYLRSSSSSNSGIAGQGGAITLTAGNGNITTGYLSSSSPSSETAGGAITLTAGNGNITTGYLSSSSSSSLGTAGGAISLTAGNGNITTGDLYSSSSSNSGTAGQGGAISLTAGNGNITTGDLYSYSSSNSGTAGQGGAISLTAANDINITRNLYSYSYSRSGTAGQGGAISLIARGGDIVGIPFEYSLYDDVKQQVVTEVRSPILGSFSISEQGTAGNGGKVTLQAKNNVSNLEILTLSSDSQSGTVQVTGLRDLLLTNTNILTSKQVTVPVEPVDSGRIITLDVGGRGQSGDVAITSSGNLTFNNSSIESDTKGSDNAGNVTVSSPNLVTFNNSSIKSNTSNTGAAGRINIEAGQGITLFGSNSELSTIFAGTTNSGEAGDITLTTPQLTLQNGAKISTNTASSSAAGAITLQSHPKVENLNINLTPGTSISASTSDQGTGGNIEIKAPNAITIQGQGTITTETTGIGIAGELRIDTKHLTIADGATISASTSSPKPEGTGGSIIINATESFNLNNQASLSAQSTGAAPAGNITISTGQLTANNGAIATSSEQSSGGDINITASNIRLFGNSDITTTVNSGTGKGGDITLTAGSIVAFGDSDILAYAPTGTGGNITLDTPAFFGENYRPATPGTDPRTLEGNNRVDVNATGVVSGVITTPDVSFIQNSLAELPNNQINTDQLLASSCIVRRNQPVRGSFTVTGTGGLPERPGDLQMSSFPTVDIGTLPTDSTSSTTLPNRPWQKGDPIIEPQGVYRLPNGKLVLSRECS